MSTLGLAHHFNVCVSVSVCVCVHGMRVRFGVGVSDSQKQQPQQIISTTHFRHFYYTPTTRTQHDCSCYHRTVLPFLAPPPPPVTKRNGVAV